MKLSKYFVFLLLLLIIPFIGFAIECDTSKIIIRVLSNPVINGDTEEIYEAHADGKKLYLNLNMKNVGDSITYQLEIVNDSSDDYEFDDIDLGLDSDYFNYTLDSEDDSYVVKANTKNVMSLKIEYKNDVPDSNFESGIYRNTKLMKVNLSSGETIDVPDTLKISYYLSIVLVVILSVIAIILIVKRNKNAKVLLLVIGLLLTVPLTVHAICKCEIEIDSSIQVDTLDDSFCMYELTDTGLISDANKIKIPMKKDTTWNEFLTYASSRIDSRFTYEVGTICKHNPLLDCYSYGSEGFNEHLNDDDYYKDYLLSYKQYDIEWHSKDYSSDPDGYFWEGIDSYYVDDDDTFNGYSVNSHLDDEIDNFDSGICYCFGCG